VWSVVSAAPTTGATHASLTAALRDDDGHAWSFVATSTDQATTTVRLERDDHAEVFTLTSSPGHADSHLDADGRHWVADAAAEPLSAWSGAVSEVSVKIGKFVQPYNAAAVDHGSTDSWCNTACSVGCSIASSAAGAMAALIACEAAIAWTGAGATMCPWIVATGIGAYFSVTCTSDCVNTFCGPTCSWYDCQGNCNGSVWNDACGVCGGDGRSCCNNRCSAPFYCDGGTGNCICTGSCVGLMCGQGDGCGNRCPTSDIDACGVCGGDGSSCGGGGGGGCGWYDCSGACNGDDWGCYI
jgi:hypothetical protein